MSNERAKILIVDDDAMNRVVLSDLLSDEYDIIEAKGGDEAIEILEKMAKEITLVLLDMVMPGRDGLEVLQVMNEKDWIKGTPVVMISAETSSPHVEKAFALGVTDFIYRPFDQMVVQNRVRNTIGLYVKQMQLSELVTDNIYERTRNSDMLISILSHIVEFRNGESGQHVLHIKKITEILLRALLARTSEYNFTEDEIDSIATASSMHDIGKITIPDEILNKPGKLTKEEFDIMKQHSMNGAKMLDAIQFFKKEPLMKFAYDICRWHHERWDGRGYPDGLKGNDIPISAQVVSIADVYDALTSERCYKKAFTHEKALEMIRNNECGVFNPLLLECLGDVADRLPQEINDQRTNNLSEAEFSKIARSIFESTEDDTNNIIAEQYINEHKKSLFFASLQRGVTFEYTYEPSLLKLETKRAKDLSFPKTMVEPENNPDFWNIFGRENWDEFARLLHDPQLNNDSFIFNSDMRIKGQKKPCKIKVQQNWNRRDPENPELISIYGCVEFIK
ncbi:HD-GYP domain-containing protein [Fibrobacter sp. UWB11]|uniref:HD-GYP domain-containing protein n=1 Tax=Fibrobacter sp. UWB11 TaxID=1896202 RepID=UPI00092BB9A7|nr:HD domain-containing phosphohydrolase [Fibrobacter sp. UWB11]SIO29104.1 Response regulator c-di-GMP phosphodiesterase, RpfG family, contains REC and HD-GYP domains [Fibrobacter sp. UWB11]